MVLHWLAYGDYFIYSKCLAIISNCSKLFLAISSVPVYWPDMQRRGETTVLTWLSKSEEVLAQDLDLDLAIADSIK